MADLRCIFDWKFQDRGWIWTKQVVRSMYLNKINTIHPLSWSCQSNSHLSFQICHENIKKPLDGSYLADFGIDITLYISSPFQGVSQLDKIAMGRRCQREWWQLRGLKNQLLMERQTDSLVEIVENMQNRCLEETYYKYF